MNVKSIDRLGRRRKLGTFNIGLEEITRHTVDDAVQLPQTEGLAPAFMPQYSALDEILARPNLDQRLMHLMQPLSLDAGLLDPAVLSQTRLDLQEIFGKEANIRIGSERQAFKQAEKTLGKYSRLGKLVEEYVAALLRG
jgi:hypothetical protein